ncbi:putative extracellular solute-binding protein [Klebsiella quasipneumoniae]|nr:putative extracellular solute-binding protein [Klebsiella quasipneumoniae]
MALDKDIIAGKVLGQGQRPAWVISQPDIGGVTLHNPDYASWPREKRIAEAKKLLAQAGYDDSHPLVFTLLYNTYESHQRIAIAASSMWKKNLGVEVKLQNQEWKTMLDTMHTHNFDAVRYAWTADYDDAATFLNTSVPGIARTPVSTATRLTMRRCAMRRKPPTWRAGANTINRRKICWRRMFPPFRSITMCVPI